MEIRKFTDDEQKLFRQVLENFGKEKEEAIQKLIDAGLDNEAAIVQWLERTGNHDLYEKIKNVSIIS